MITRWISKNEAIVNIYHSVASGVKQHQQGRHSDTTQLFAHIQTGKENINLFSQLLGIAPNMWKNIISCRNNV